MCTKKMTNPLLRVVILFANLYLVSSLTSSNILAQDSNARPKVGLALSGGGSRGFAHIGVLKVMEEAGLRPDYITGVSMGSIVGGFYSLGYSTDSLIQIVKKLDWDLLLSNKIPLNKVISFEKNEFNNSIFSLPVSSKKVILPSGLINGQQIESTFSYYLWPAADISDFSKLPVPFLCVGSDIISCKKVDLTKGYLPDAIRASMAVPSIFTPIKIDSLLLMDGGLTRNIAASELKDMGADIIIGSYTGRRLYKEDDLKSVTGVMLQIASFTGLLDSENQKKLVDILIEPDVLDIPPNIFKNTEEIIQIGYRAALPYKERFRKIADSLNNIGPQKPIENILNKQLYKFDKIEVTGNNIYSFDQITGVLNILPGDYVDKDLLNERIELLYGKVWFDKIKYRIVPRNDSLILNIDCIERPKAIINGSVHYDNNLQFGMLLGISAKNILTKRSFLNFDAFLARNYRFKLACTQFIDREQKYGISANFYADNTLLPGMKIRGETGDAASRNHFGSLSLSRSFGLNHMMIISSGIENMLLIPEFSSIDHVQKSSFNYLSANYEYKVNTLDTKHFPNKGILLNLSASASKLLSAGIKTDTSHTVPVGTGLAEPFITLTGNFKQYFSSDGKFTFSVSGDLLYISDADSISSQNNFYLLGGFESVNWRSVPMIGYQANEMAVKRLAGFGAELDCEIFEKVHLCLSAKVAEIQLIDDKKEYSFISGYGLGIGYLSVIGPLKIGIMGGNYNNERFFKGLKGYVSIGYNF